MAGLISQQLTLAVKYVIDSNIYEELLKMEMGRCQYD